MKENYWVEQIAKKDAIIKDLSDKLNEAYKDGEYYRGLYVATMDKITARVEIDTTFEDVTEE